MTSLAAQAFRFLRNPAILPVYLPTFFFGMALGMIRPVLPLYVADFDVSYALIGLVLGAEALGAMLADVPAGVLLRRFSEKQVMLAGQILVMLGMLLLFLAPSVWMAFVSLFLFGTGRALFNVSRHMFLSEQFAVGQRGRAIAVFGGMVRMGYAVGPIIGGLIAARLGLRAPFLFVCAVAVFGLVLVALLLKETRRRDRSRSREEGLAVVETLRDNRPLLARAGSGVLFGQAIRAGRSVIVPLYAADVLGLGPEAIGVIVSVSWALDMLMFLPAGWVMDKRGRKHAIVPSFLTMATGIALIPLTHSFEGLLLATALIGLGKRLQQRLDDDSRLGPGAGANAQRIPRSLAPDRRFGGDRRALRHRLCRPATGPAVGGRGGFRHGFDGGRHLRLPGAGNVEVPAAGTGARSSFGELKCRTCSLLKSFCMNCGRRVSGELRSDRYSRMLYSTDASIYQQMPLAVLIARTVDDVQAAVELAARHRVPVLPRASGSSLAGQAVNEALVIDSTRWLDGIHEINREERWVRVGPGRVLDELNLALKPHGLQFGPDPASSNRAAMGGIVSKQLDRQPLDSLRHDGRPRAGGRGHPCGRQPHAHGPAE